MSFVNKCLPLKVCIFEMLAKNVTSQGLIKLKFKIT